MVQVGHETMINAYVILILIEVLNFDTLMDHCYGMVQYVYE